MAAYSHFSITMHAFRCTLAGGKNTPDCDRPWKWVQEHELSLYTFPKANHKIFEQLAISNC